MDFCCRTDYSAHQPHGAARELSASTRELLCQTYGCWSIHPSPEVMLWHGRRAAETVCRTKCPPAASRKSSPKSFVSGQETDEGFLRRPPGIERGRHSGSTAHRAVPGGSASGGRGGGGGGSPLAVLRHRWPMPAASPLPADTQQQPGTCCIPSLPRLQAQAVGEPWSHPGHTTMSLLGTPACRRASCTQAQTFPTRSFFWSTRCSDQKFP